MYEAVERLTPETLYALSHRTFIEMLESGFTSVAEFHYIHHQAKGIPYEDSNLLADTVIQAALDAGIRITLLRVLYFRSGFGNQPLSPGQLRFCDKDLDASMTSWHALRSRWQSHPHVKLGVAPHSVRAVPGEVLRTIARTFPVGEHPLHIHVSEQIA